MSMPLSRIGSYSHIYIGVTYRCLGLTCTSYIGILCHDICILAIRKVDTGLLDVVT
ncbi:PHD finger C17D11.04c [Gossypium arboreum]|uniref:PHD finger C17D11.04c n=1 Tax=Gossypium arboreum TaxID=29729 RepID=A0A0B0NX76_GOSAR|nr:PHD finger C17D11.04c [Gossypium arboreum]